MGGGRCEAENAPVERFQADTGGRLSAPRVVMQYANRCTRSGVVKPRKAESNERAQWAIQRGGSPVSKRALGSRPAATLRDLCELWAR